MWANWTCPLTFLLFRPGFRVTYHIGTPGNRLGDEYLNHLIACWLERVRLASMGNGSAKYIRLIEGYLDVKKRQNKLKYLGGNIWEINIDIYLCNKEKLSFILSNVQTNLEQTDVHIIFTTEICSHNMNAVNIKYWVYCSLERPASISCNGIII